METLKVNIGSPEENARVLEIFNGPDGPLLNRYFDQKVSLAMKNHKEKVILNYAKDVFKKKVLELIDEYCL
jgi:hypothetical protein